MFSCKAILVNKDYTSKLPMKESHCWLTIFPARSKECFTVNFLVVKGFKIGTNITSSLKIRVFKADKIN